MAIRKQKKVSAGQDFIDQKIRQTAKKLMVDEADVRACIEQYMRWVPEMMRRPEHPRMRVPKLGRLTGNEKVLKRRINYRIRQYRLGEISYEETVDIIKELWPIYKNRVDLNQRRQRKDPYSTLSWEDKKKYWEAGEEERKLILEESKQEKDE